MHDIREATKVDTAIKPQVGAAAITGEWFNMKEYAKALFTAQVSLQQNGEEAVFDVYQALNAAGGTELQLGAAITMLQGVKITMGQVVCAAVSVNDTLKITPYTFVNGVVTAGTLLTFTAKAAESLANRQFINTGNNEAATSLAACINDATYGVPGMLAVATDATVLLTMTEPGDGMFDITELAGAVARLVVTDLIQQADFEVAVQDLTRNSDYTHVGARFSAIETDVATSCQLIRAVAGYQPVGQVSAYNDDAS